MKKIDLEKIKNFRITKEDLGKFLGVFLKNRRLFFIIFWGIVLVYSFDVLYKKAYIEIEFVTCDFSGDFGFNGEISSLDKISEEIDTRENNLIKGKNSSYRNPFRFDLSESNVSVEENNDIKIEDIKSGGF